jgi:nucleotide-binding universal stress UspA family protein
MDEWPVYRRILNATDGSETSEQASRHALALAQQLGAQLELLAVVEGDFQAGIRLHAEIAEQVKESQETLDRLESSARARGVAVTKLMVTGEPGPTIVNVAGDSGADLIVVGVHRMGRLERVILGSTSHYVVQHASVPVVVVRQQDARAEIRHSWSTRGLFRRGTAQQGVVLLLRQSVLPNHPLAGIAVGSVTADPMIRDTMTG